MAMRFLLVAALLPVALPAFAEDVPLPPITPEGQYLVMTQDDATSSSQCIGDPATPMCAVETMLACWHRARDDLCRVAMDVDQDPHFGGKSPGPNIIYRVVRTRTLTDRIFPWSPERDRSWRPGGLTMRAGDVQIDVVEKNCWHEVSAKACEPVWSLVPTAFIIRKNGERWIVITWGFAYDPRDRHRK